MLEIRVLGPLEVVADGTSLVVDTRKALAILALLAVELAGELPVRGLDLAGGRSPATPSTT